MGSSRKYWQYARECARWAAQTKDEEKQDLFIEMAKAWTNIALVEGRCNEAGSARTTRGFSHARRTRTTRCRFALGLISGSGLAAARDAALLLSHRAAPVSLSRNTTLSPGLSGSASVRTSLT
jgi:hypothetical protein